MVVPISYLTPSTYCGNLQSQIVNNATNVFEMSKYLLTTFHSHSKPRFGAFVFHAENITHSRLALLINTTSPHCKMFFYDYYFFVFILFYLFIYNYITIYLI